MTALDTWRSRLPQAFETFGGLTKRDKSISLPYGILAGAILWAVRDAPFEADSRQLIEQVCNAKDTAQVLRALDGWDALEPLEAARSLAKRAANSKILRAALDKLLLQFVDDLLAHQLLQPAASASLTGDTNAANLNLGGTQYFAGNQIIHYMTRNAARVCPGAPTPPPLGGRDAEIADLIAKLKAGQTVAITALHGIGGIGKTALAQEVAHQLYQDKTFRAVLWTKVTRSPQALELLRGWAAYADTSFEGANAPPEQLALQVKRMLEALIEEACERCEPSRVLVVLDDVWEGAGRQAARLLQTACPAGSTVLITTRSENLAIDLGATRETLTQLDRLRGLDAVAMLRLYLPAAGDEALLALAEALGGHALALKLAAQRLLKTRNLAAKLAAQTQQYRDGVAAGTAFAALELEPGDDREDNLKVALSYSYKELSPDAQGRFRALGILAFDQAFDLALLAALWDVDLAEAEGYAEELRLRSLLEGDESGDSWYRQHPLLRSYARALLTAAGETEPLFARYADFVIGTAAQFNSLPPEAWGALAGQLPHLHDVGDQLVQRWKASAELDEAESTRMLAFANNVTRYLHMRREVRRHDWLELGLEVSRQQQNQAYKLLFMNEIGLSYSAFGEQRQALDYFEQALPLTRAVSDRSGEAVTLSNLGAVYADLGEGRQALDYFEQGLALQQAVGDRSGEASTLSNLGAVYADLGEGRQALDYFEQALPLRRAMGDRGGEAATLTNLGAVYSALGEGRQALDYFEQALPLFQAVGDRSGEAATLSNLGAVYADLGEPRRALAYYAQALPLRRAVGDRSGEAVTLSNLGAVYADLGEGRQALDYFEQALALQQAVGDRIGEAVTLSNIGSAYSALGEKRQALDYYAQALPLRRAVGDRSGEATTLSNIGSAYSALGEKRQALDYFEQALPLRRAVGDRSGEAVTLSNIGKVYADLGELRQVLDYYQQALQLFRAVGDRRGEAVTSFNIGMLYARQGDLDQAIPFVERTVELDALVEHPDLESDRATLEDLKRRRAGGAAPTPETQVQQFMARLVRLYQSEGAEAVRQLLQQAKLPDEAIHTLLEQLRNASDSTVTNDEENTL